MSHNINILKNGTIISGTPNCLASDADVSDSRIRIVVFSVSIIPAAELSVGKNPVEPIWISLE